ncbi:hypothetical protein DNTS_008246 [Danionella cerebrum]|uniref:Fibronectin type-III domain-containing protein n=1 Tax=Danionella cerebrum TaxID=2873325 RepID=A0A553QRE3_9TELE|nr:hypothetical protein DNTS_008246 [Danionella translucida]
MSRPPSLPPSLPSSSGKPSAAAVGASVSVECFLACLSGTGHRLVKRREIHGEARAAQLYTSLVALYLILLFTAENQEALNLIPASVSAPGGSKLVLNSLALSGSHRFKREKKCCSPSSETMWVFVMIALLVNLVYASQGNCLDIQCWPEGEGTSLVCNAASAAVGQVRSGSHQFLVQMYLLSEETDVSVKCTGADNVTCSIPLAGGDAMVSLNISLSINGTTAHSPKMQVSTHNLRQRPDPPADLHYNVTVENKGIFRWRYAQCDRNITSCEIRYSSDSLLQKWAVVKVKGYSWTPPNELSSGIRYMVQVRCRNRFNHWSDWSQPYYQILGVSYIPREVFTTPGSEVTVRAILHKRNWDATKVVWMLNSQVKIPKSQYTVINHQISAVTLKLDQPGFDSLMCCHPWGETLNCSIAYVKIYTEGMFNADITCQSKEDMMSCEWKKSAWAQVRLLYRQYGSMCENASLMEEREKAENMSSVKECTFGAGDHRECTIHDLSLFSCYKMWLEVQGGRGKVRSVPVYIQPIDHVKPQPPSVINAVTLPNKTLSVWWERPPFPSYDMQSQLRFVALRGKASIDWKVIGPLLEANAEILLEESCVPYKVEVCCKSLSGSGHWSDWSRSYTSTVYNRKAPDMGPDFWRIIQEDSTRNVTNITLIFKQPIVAGDADSCVEGLVIKHTSGDAVWSIETTVVPFHFFQWSTEVHTVMVMTHNAKGISQRNREMTFQHQPKRPSVYSFSVVANASCVYLSWSLLSDQPVPESFVIEWLDLKKELEKDESLTDRLQWIRVQSTSRDVSLCRHFYGTEEFTLYPVFEDGEGLPVRNKATRSDPAAYILLLIIGFLSMVLFVTLLMSQNHVRKLMWKDVPNPNNCSWAKGMDFKQIDAMESLFPLSGGLTSYPLLLVSENICEVEIIEKPLIFTLEHEKDGDVLNSSSKFQTVTNPSVEDSTESLSLKAEPSGQASVTYSTILLSHQTNLLQKPQESLSSSSDEGNFSANNSDISGSFPGRLWDLEGQMDTANPRHSSCYNSVEEFSDASEQDYEASESMAGAKVLYYLKMNEEERGEAEFEIAEDKNEIVLTPHKSINVSVNIPIYMPQFRTETINPP